MFLAFSGTPAHNHLIVWVAVRIALWKRGGGGGGGRWRSVGGAGVRGREKREKGRREKGGREKGREGRMGGRCRRRVVQEQEDRSTAGTDGLLGLKRVLPDKDAPCSVLMPQ